MTTLFSRAGLNASPGTNASSSLGCAAFALWATALPSVREKRLARLVEDLLSLSRLDRIALNVQPMNLRTAAEARTVANLTIGKHVRRVSFE